MVVILLKGPKMPFFCNLQKHVHRVYCFLESHNAIYEHRYGFRKQHSTNHALINITDKIRDALDKNLLAVGVFIDFQKAFDTVNHDILTKKLENYGIRGCINNWFQSYLNNRKQYVSKWL